MSHVAPAPLPAGVLRGRGIGIVVATAFAAAWVNWAKPLLLRLPGIWPWLVAVAVVATCVALMTAGIALIRRGRKLANGAADGSTRRTMRRRFLLVLAGELVALNLAAFLLFRYDLPQYLPPAVAIIVGLHFFPLAPTFKAPHFHATASVMTLAGVAAVLAIAQGGNIVTADGLAEIACALTLWATAFVSWQRTRSALAADIAQAA